MINTPSFDDFDEKQQKKIKEYLASVRADAVDEATYQEIYALIPEEYLEEKDKTWDEFGLIRKSTKRRLNKKKDAELLNKLRQFAKEKHLKYPNQLNFNEHFEDIFVWTIYLPKD